LGRLLIYTRQMDMMMHSEAHVDRLTEWFLKGNYKLDPAACDRGKHETPATGVTGEP
jgi:hypothetical protein